MSTDSIAADIYQQTHCTKAWCIITMTFAQNFLHFFALQTKKNKTLRRNLCISRAVFLSSGYDAQWCHQIFEKQVTKTEHSCCRNAGNVHFQLFLALWGYRGSWNWPNSLKTEEHPSIWQPRVSFKRLTGSKGVRRDVHDKRQLQTIGGSVGMSVLKCRWTKAYKSESSWPGPNVKQLSILVSNGSQFFLTVFSLMVERGTMCSEKLPGTCCNCVSNPFDYWVKWKQIKNGFILILCQCEYFYH